MQFGLLEREMAGAFQIELAPLSVAAFRDWAASRPDEERWELIDGVPMMMAPPTRDHQRIASNLERLLNDALERAAGGSIPRLAAYQRIGLNLGPAVQHYDPEPDVAVVELAVNEALSMAKEALTLHIENMLEHGEEIQVATPADKIDRGDALLMAAIDLIG